MKRIFYFLMLFTALAFTSCNKDYSGDIEDYLAENNLTAIKTEDGLYYIIDVPGNDKKPKVNSEVRVKYKGTLLDGTVFDENADFRTNLSKVIAGWRYGMVHFGEGGKGKLLIPPHLGYGDQETGDIPGNSVLIFDIELIEVF
ncbi:MAG: FKBP-type peptidyl-prolyl cis-trans isomerase [Saprospiraceae bacterium]|nr:FKBP-type peptidyl-prolyl cis-trans isomerase [Saprospiraceae bacterium]